MAQLIVNVGQIVVRNRIFWIEGNGLVIGGEGLAQFAHVPGSDALIVLCKLILWVKGDGLVILEDGLLRLVGCQEEIAKTKIGGN